MTRVPVRKFGSTVGLAALVTAGLTLVAPPVVADEFSVTNNNDAGPGSLRQAFIDADNNPGDDVIVVQPGVGVITLTTGPLTHVPAAPDDLAVEGNGTTINANGSGGMAVNNTPNLSLDRVTLTGGTGGAAGVGGGAVWTAGNLELTNSTVTGNNTSGTGGQGGGLLAENDMTITNSTISDNIGSDGDGGGVHADANLTITASTFVENNAADNGGAAFADGSMIVVNSTFTNNSAEGDGGGALAGGSMTMRYATVVQNTNGIAANILVFPGALETFGSVIALPQGGGPNCTFPGAAPVSNGYNFSDDASCGLTASTDRPDAGDPLLFALQGNGGLTQTRLPQPGSPLIDAIDAVDCNFDGITTDQRGVSRPQGPGCDIGAVEVQVTAPAGAAAPVVAPPRFTG